MATGHSRRRCIATLQEAIGGLLIGTVAGVAVGFAVARWGTVRESVLPLAIAANAIPIIAIAPIFNNWFGVLNPLSKMMIAALPRLLPGDDQRHPRALRRSSRAALELMRSYAASEWTVLAKVSAPERAPVLPHRAQDRHHAEPHRRGGGRVLRRDDRR